MSVEEGPAIKKKREELKPVEGNSGFLTREESQIIENKLKYDTPSGMTRDQYVTLETNGYFPNTEAKAAFEALLNDGIFDMTSIAKSLASLPNITTTLKRTRGGGRNKQRGGKDCDRKDYAILVAMMAVLYWTGAIPAAATVAYKTVSTQVEIVTSYMPGIDTIMDKMGLCMTYFSTFIPSAFPGDELAYAVGTVANTFVRKVGEMLIILAEAANLSLKMGFSVGAKTIWDTTINWVKDNPTYVLAGYAGKKALAWRADAIALKAIKDAEATGAPPVALTPEQLKTYKESLGDIFHRIRNLLCDLTGAIISGTEDALKQLLERFDSSSTPTTATTGTNTDGDSIKEIKKDLTLLEGLADAAAAAAEVEEVMKSVIEYAAANEKEIPEDYIPFIKKTILEAVLAKEQAEKEYTGPDDQRPRIADQRLVNITNPEGAGSWDDYLEWVKNPPPLTTRPMPGGGKRSTRKRNGRTRKPKTRKPKKRKSSGRKAKKVSRKMKSRKGRKTRRRGSKKR